nr:DUF354 domain-containing protein [Parahaliea mediterranea]
MDNTPHVPFFRPIIAQLTDRGEKVAVTAREAFQVCQLADLLGVRYQKIGRHYGKNPFLKITGLVWRSVQMIPFVLRKRPSLALSHGSRSQILICNLLRIPTVMLMDYEHAKTPLLLRPRWQIVPSAIWSERLQCRNRKRILAYDGIKEDVYAHDFVVDPSLPGALGINTDKIVVTVRPPATESHYHQAESDLLFEAFMDRACSNSELQIILLPRNRKQEAFYRASHPEWFIGKRVIVPEIAVNGLDLLWHSDLVVSGGGTMNREAAALNVPVYSIFRGPAGLVDKELARQRRLVMVDSVSAVQEIGLRKKTSRPIEETQNTPLTTILEHIEEILRQENLCSQAHAV